jgi:outer membrane protein TolC
MHSAVLALVLLASPNTAPAPAQGPERITFEEAVRRALAHNVATQVSLIEIRRAEGLLSEARAGSLPTAVANGTYTRLDANRTLTTTNQVILSQDQFGANAVATLPILVPSRWAQWSHGVDNLEDAKASDADVRRQTAITAARAYLGILAQKRVLDATVRARDTARAHYIFSRTRREGGVGNRVDEVRAEQELATDEARIQAEFAFLFRAQEALGVIAGADAPLDAVEEPAFSSPPSAADATREAEERRQDIRAAQVRASAADHVSRDSWLDYLPSLLGTFQPFYQAPPTLTQPRRGWQAQLLLSINIYDGGTRSGQAKERDALASEARTQLDGLLRQARSEVRVAFNSVQRADAALSESRRAADRANEALQLSNRAYQAGATSNLEVIDAERRARDAETAAVVAEDAVHQARLDLLSATGHFP